mgnify:CR=1 FL=1
MWSALGRRTLDDLQVHPFLVIDDRAERLRELRRQRAVGRDQVVSLLIDSWEQAEDRQGQAVLISGEARIGKSRLLQDMNNLTDNPVDV